MGKLLNISLASAAALAGIAGAMAGDGIFSPPMAAAPPTAGIGLPPNAFQPQPGYTNIQPQPRLNFGPAPFAPGKPETIPTNWFWLTNQPGTALGANVLKSRNALDPGVYISKPYSMIVLVPRGIDPRMAVAPRNDFTAPMPTISPKMHFEKIAPAPTLFAERMSPPELQEHASGGANSNGASADKP